MKTLKLVTITGADDLTSIEDIKDISNNFPFVEWGLLFSRTKTGIDPRFPSLKWLSEISHVDVNKSVHICGQLAREALNAPSSVFTTIKTLVGGVNRIQLNVSNVMHLINDDVLFKIECEAQNLGLQLIIQVPSFESEIFKNHKPSRLQNWFLDGKPFFSNPAITALDDASGGRGIDGSFSCPPNGWVMPGFAGGIKPENIKAKIESINSMVGDFEEFWIDMESGVRTENNLDMEKVKQILECCENFARNGEVRIDTKPPSWRW